MTAVLLGLSFGLNFLLAAALLIARDQVNYERQRADSSDRWADRMYGYVEELRRKLREVIGDE
jgi:hypothetical protein